MYLYISLCVYIYIYICMYIIIVLLIIIHITVTIMVLAGPPLGGAGRRGHGGPQGRSGSAPPHVTTLCYDMV